MCYATAYRGVADRMFALCKYGDALNQLALVQTSSKALSYLRPLKSFWMMELRNALPLTAGELCSQVTRVGLCTVCICCPTHHQLCSSAAGCVDGGVVIWDTETRGVAQRYKPHRYA